MDQSTRTPSASSDAGAQPRKVSRRTFLLSTAVLPAGAAVLAACGTTTTTATPTTAPTTAAATAAPTTAVAATTAPTIAATEAATTVATTAATEAATTATAAETAAATGGAQTAVVNAANAFLATLSDDERSSVLFEFTNTEQRQRWSNLPEGLYTRDGLMWGDISEEQQNAWLALMQTTLSTEGYDRVLTEWYADDALSSSDSGGGGGAPSADGTAQANGTAPADGTAQAGGPPAMDGTMQAGGPPNVDGTAQAGGFPGGQGGGGLLYGREYYWVAIIGTPSETDPWQWQWGGHHVTVNATVVGANIALTPSFIGVQPGEYTDASGTTVRPLGDIDDEAFALINSLDDTQKQSAVLGDSYIDLVLGPGQDGKTIQSEGLPGSQMTTEQQTALLTLISHYTGLVKDDVAATRRAEIEADLANTYLAWYGPTEAGSASYFRVTGPTVVIEYSPQSMGGDAAAHIHGIYRDPSNEYGAKYTGVTIGS